MIWTIIQTSWRRLRNNRSELFLTFIVPMVFFSIFAVIFGSRDSGGSSTPKIKVAICDDASSPMSSRAIELLGEQKSLRITDRRAAAKSNEANTTTAVVDRETAEDLVRRGMVSAAIVFKAPTEDSVAQVQIMSDAFDQVASQVLSALVQRAVMTAQGEIAKTAASAQRTSPTSTAVPPAFPISPPSAVPPSVVQPAHFTSSATDSLPNTPTLATVAEPPSVEMIDVLGGKKTNPVVAMYAAGIAVMFLLFSATTASGSLLEERENSTLDRILCSQLSMDQLLLGKWAYLTIIGSIQMTLMFIWGSLVFGIELVRHLEGFVAMTLVTAGAASAFALMLAALCKSRMQLGWVSTIVILSMSALGGSMVPRYLMSESIQRVGLLTFNAWALEGYNKVFWRELPLRDVGTELGVLTACGFLFIVAARLFAVRWERT